MNEFQDAILESLQDNISYLAEKYADNSKIVQADDYLKIKAPVKKPNGRYLSVADDFITEMLKDESCSRTIAGYRHIATGTYFAKNDLTAKANLDLYNPVYKLTIKPDDHTTIIYDRNNLTICLYKLAHCNESRYKSLIDTLINSSIFVHKSRAELPTNKRVYNSMRQIIDRDFKMFKYEWSYTFNAEISRAILPAIKRLAINHEYGCYYLNTGNRVQCKVKVYNITALNPIRKSQKYQYRPNDQLKLELTYTAEYFRARPELSIATFKKQRDAFIALHADNMAIFVKIIINKMKPVELKKLLNTAKVKSKTELIAHLNEERTMQTSVDAQIAEIRARQARLERMHAELKADNAEFKAKFAENNAQFDEIRQFIGMHDARTDTRKLRIV